MASAPMGRMLAMFSRGTDPMRPLEAAQKTRRSVTANRRRVARSRWYADVMKENAQKAAKRPGRMAE
jgi:hypothetical protein